MKLRRSTFERKKMWTLASITGVVVPSLCTIAMRTLLRGRLRGATALAPTRT